MTQLYTKFKILKFKYPDQLEDELNKIKAQGFGIMRCQITSHQEPAMDHHLICLLELGWRKEDLDNGR